MNNKICSLLAAIACVAASSTAVLGWGIWGHSHINRGAVMALPKEMGMFFYNHIDYITEESTVPDLRKYTMGDRQEAPRHYCDLEWFHYSGRASMPATLQDAIAQYGKDSLDKYGILPWYIPEMVNKLTEAFKHKRKAEILLIAADLGHYVGDAHMPLHTSVNHNGQFTGQEGIHAFWEAQLPEQFGKNYKLYVGDVRYIDNVQQATWDMIDSSHALVEELLQKEAKMKKDNPLDKQYVLGPDGAPQKNKFGQPIHTYEYAHIYHELLNGMVERQMRLALKHTAELWYTAWVNAGKPDLSELDAQFIIDRNIPLWKQDMKYWQTGKVRGCGSDKEF